MEKWCIKPKDKEQYIIISKWFDENWGCSGKIGYKFYQNYGFDGSYLVYGIAPGNVLFSKPQGIKLTFEQFQTQILNKSIEPNYEIY